MNNRTASERYGWFRWRRQRVPNVLTKVAVDPLSSLSLHERAIAKTNLQRVLPPHSQQSGAADVH